MNDYEPSIEEPISSAASECCAEVDECVRRNPGTALLIAVGAGLVIGLLVRGLRPEPTPRHRLAQLLEDIECRLHVGVVRHFRCHAAFELRHIGQQLSFREDR